MDDTVYFTSCHIITFTVAKIKQPIQVEAAWSFSFKFTINLSLRAMVLSLCCTLQLSWFRVEKLLLTESKPRQSNSINLNCSLDMRNL